MLKRMRPALLRRYGDRLEHLYVELERQRNEELFALHDPNSGLSVVERIGKALETVLGIGDIDPTQPDSFVAMGGDSLGATELSTLLEDIFGVSPPVSSILSSTGNPERWARDIEAALAGDDVTRPTFTRIHGTHPDRLVDTDLNIVAFLGEEWIDSVPSEPPPDEPRTVLLTGATGFLGRFLAVEWMQRFADNRGKVICLVRAADHDAAVRRLAGVFANADSQLEQRFATLAVEHLEVIVGDAAEPRLGLSVTEFNRLAHEVDCIVHCGALVNHVLTYEDLFGPNVAGTAELIRLALTGRQKRFDFVSSLAAARLVEHGLGDGEETPLQSELALQSGYAAGYGASKWAGEHLLHSAHRQFGLPVNILRGDMMLAPAAYSGHLNLKDIFTRLLYSIVMTGLAPASFYLPRPDGGRAQAHYDGLPVDFVAASIVGISHDSHHQIRTFHVVNHHTDDGAGLDTFVDWIEAAGYPIEREPDYQRWTERFEAKLRAMPEGQRQHSALPILHAFARPQESDTPSVDSRRFRDAVRVLPSGPEIPRITRESINAYLDDLRSMGLIPSPTAAT
ncbi:MAG: thioester reductase domain-containing protein [Actinomycetota bacterium]